jgi:glycosyltransferase involved in cell wall biosynthesis
MISVVIPAHNESTLIQACLESFRLQQFTQPFEVIVVNNGSTDDTVQKIEAYKERFPTFDVRVVDEPRLGIAQACQTGLLAARYDILARTDADTVVAPDWLARMAHHYANPHVMAVGGNIQYESNQLFGLGSRLFRSWHNWAGIPYYFGTNMSIRRAAFVATGGFNTALKRTEDIDISRRLWLVYRQPGQLIFDSELLVTTSLRKYRSLSQSLHNLPLGVWSYVKTMFEYGWARSMGVWIKS